MKDYHSKSQCVTQQQLAAATKTCKAKETNVHKGQFFLNPCFKTTVVYNGMVVKQHPIQSLIHTQISI